MKLNGNGSQYRVSGCLLIKRDRIKVPDGLLPKCNGFSILRGFIALSALLIDRCGS
ncbi:hypothetical protein IFO70_28930 [Phormidium tenue FACHB-886]|nr:hypothetical protein [Phormidium tenue FACHB-886]